MAARKLTPGKRADLTLEQRPIATVKPSPKNTRAHSPDQVDRLRASLNRFGWTKPIVVDEKGEILAGHGIYQAALQGSTATDDVWMVGRDDGSDIHPTAKPVELARRAIVNSSVEGDIVLDPFSGSASTIMAAHQTGRIGYAAELDPIYVDAGVLRWQTMTGLEAIHAETGKTYATTAKARRRGK